MAQPTLMNLHPSYYTDPAVYGRERQAIFRRHWQMLGPASEVQAPGQYVAVEAAGWKLFAMRGRDGTLRAFHNVCPHRGARLLEEGSGRCDVLRCPYHQWMFDGTGRLRRAPHFGEDRGFSLADWPLEPVAAETWRGPLFVAIAPETSLAGTPLKSYTVAETVRFAIGCNWKTYTDNFVEGYTCRAPTRVLRRSWTSRTSFGTGVLVV